MPLNDRRLHITGIESLERIQAIGFMAIFVAMMTLSMSPIWTKATAEEHYTLYPWALRGIDSDGLIVHEKFSSYFYIGLLCVASALTSLYQLARFDSRHAQLGIGAINTIIITLTLWVGCHFGERLNSSIAPEIAGQYSEEFANAIIASFISNALAALFILRDERLIKTVGRLRRDLLS